MFRQRFKGLRSVRIVSWTAVAIGWVTAVIARVAIAGPQAPLADPTPPQLAPQTVFVPATQTATTPTLPDRGLVVIRHTPTAQPAPVAPTPVVRRVVIQQTAPAPAVTQPAPARSSGS